MFAAPPQRFVQNGCVSELVAALRTAGCVFAEDEARLLTEAAPSTADLDALVRRRVAGEPLEHVLGWAEFRGLRVAVRPGVFVPRRRTEFLVALATELGDVELYAADVDPACVACARENLAPVGGRVLEGDLADPLPARLRGRVDVLTVNAPYVPTAAIALMPPEARLHEPAVALDGGADGLDVLRRVVDVAPEWLAPDGHLLFETSEAQAPVMAAYAVAAGLVPAVATSDDTTVLVLSR
jgi:release factor glutamine methyltransferase